MSDKSTLFASGDSMKPNDRLMDKVHEKCDEATSLMEAIEGYEEAMSLAKSRLHQLRTIDIPEALAEAGIGSKLTLANGYEIEIVQIVSGSIPKKDPEKMDVAFGVLRQHGGGELIKNKLSCEFPKGDDAEAERITNRLKELGYEPQLGKSVHPQSLQAWAREKLRNGEEIPTETLGLYIGSLAKIKKPENDDVIER